MRYSWFIIAVAGLVFSFAAGRQSVSMKAAAQGAGPFASFAFKGYHHGGGLAVYANGQGVEHYRTYVNCTSSLLSACDAFRGSTIYPGGFARFSLQRIVGTKAYGTIDDSSLSWEVGTTVTLVRNQNGTMTVHLPSGGYTSCGPRAPVGYCGA